MISRILYRAASVGLALSLAATTALGEPTMADKSESHTLFDRGLAEYRKAAYGEALKLFLGSQELDSGVGTLLYIGECYRQLGKPASAWGAFKEAATLAHRLGDKRGDTATSKAAEVEGLRSYLTIEVPVAARVDGLEIKRDGRPVPLAAWGSSVPVDPGAHTLEISAPGRTTEKLEVSVGEKGARVTHGVKPLALVAVAPIPSSSSSSVVAPDDAARSRGPAVEGGSGPWRTVGLVGAGVGVAVTVGGALMMKNASSRADDARTAHDTKAYENAKSSYSTGTLVLVGGLAFLAGGVTLALVNPGGSPSAAAAWTIAPAIGPGTGGLAVRGVY